MDTRQTLDLFRGFWYPSLLDRSRREQWLASGATTLGQRLNARVQDVLKERRPKPLEQGIKQRVEGILAQAGG